MADFRAIVDLCARFLQYSTSGSRSQVIRTHDGSTTMILHAVGCQCRDPKIRREAIRLLYKYKRLEGIWYSPVMAFFAEMAMMTEERNSAPVKSCSEIPPEWRVRMKNIHYTPGCLAEDAV